MTDQDPSIVAALDALERHLPELMLANLDEDNFWPQFAGVADSMIDGAQGEEQIYAKGRFDCMLTNAGLIPGEEEGEPCQT